MQRAEVERRDGREVREGRGREGRDGRGDEWADPWMRAEPAARRRRPPSSEDSYSSSRQVFLVLFFSLIHLDFNPYSFMPKVMYYLSIYVALGQFYIIIVFAR